MAELIRRVGHILVGLHLRLILVIPEPSETAIFSVFVTKPNRSQRARSEQQVVFKSEYLNISSETGKTEESPGVVSCK